MYAASGENNYRTAPTSSSTGVVVDPPTLQSQPSGGVSGNNVGSTTAGQSNSNAQSSSHMSVAAKAGEMQIFSSDILSQVNGLQRRQTNKGLMLRQGGKLSSHTNDPRLNHFADKMGNVEEKMLLIDATSIKPISQTNNRQSDMNQMLSSLQSSTNDRNQSINHQTLNPGVPRDSIGNNAMTSLQNQQRLHPTQSFGEYVANNSSQVVQSQHNRMPLMPSQYSNIGSNKHLGPLQLTHGNSIQKPSEAETGLTSNCHISNSSSVIGKVTTSYSGNEGEGARDTRQNSPIVLSQISAKHLKIEVQSSHERKRNIEAPTNVPVDQSFTPTMVRRSIGSRSGAKVQHDDRLSFLDKAAHQSNFQAIDSSQFDVKNPIPSIPTTTTAKKLQAAKFAQQQLLQNRYTNGTEANMLPKMAGINIDRKSANTSKQTTTNSSLPPPGGNLSLIQQSHLRRRHGEGSYGGGPNRLDFGIAGESLQIKLTGTSLMKPNQPRESFSQQVKKEPEPLQVKGSTAGQPPSSIVYHPKLRARLSDLNAPYNSVGASNGVSGNYSSIVSGASQTAQQQFAQHVIDMQMNSPRTSNQIFQDNPSQPRIYSYHYIYDYLFVQVTEDQYEREYAHKIRTFQRGQNSNNQDLERTPERAALRSGGDDQDTAPRMSQPVVPLQGNDFIEGSPNGRMRGPPLKLNQNQVFFSPQVARDSQGKIIPTAEHHKSTIDDAMNSRFRNSTIDGMNHDNELSSAGQPNLNSIEPGSEISMRKQVIKMKRLSLKNTMEGALQPTQFDGLKVLTKDTILRAKKTMSQGSTIDSKEEHISQIVPVLKLQKAQNPDSSAMSGSEKDAGLSEEEQVSRFMTELGHWLQEQNLRFKVTVKKKYINDILMNSKGAQNLAQNVVVVVTNNQQLSMNSPQKKVRRAKRNLSVEVSSGEEETNRHEINKNGEEHPSIRNHGQATPQVTSSKAKANQIGRRGYESENEAKSFNSTTTSSTFPNLKPGGYATKQNNTPRQPRKMSTRSLSQIPNSVRVTRKTTDDINGNGAAAGGVGGDDRLDTHHDKYPPTKIKIVQNVNKYDHHADHPINKLLNDYNEFTRLVFRSRCTEARSIANIPYAQKLGKRLGMSLTKNQLMPATLKVKENSNAIKEKLIFYMCRIIRQENDFNGQPDAACAGFNKRISDHTVQHVDQTRAALAAFDAQKNQGFHYRCYVGKGNNQMMIRALFKNRFWWLFQEKEEPDKVNFFWTQLRKLSIMNSLNCKLVNPKDKKQQQHLNAQASNQGQSLGLAIAQNSALMTTPQSSTKFKRRKLSSAQSKSPEGPSLTNKQLPVSQADIVSPANNTVAMTLVGVKNQRQSETSVNLTEAEERKIDIAPVTAAPPQEKPQAPAPEKVATKEEKKEQVKIKLSDTYPAKLANKIEDNYHLCNKKALFMNMKNYYDATGEDPFDGLPVTFHIKEGTDDPNYQAFAKYYEENQDANNIWITKPGECTNRGVGIQVAKEWHELQSIIVDSTRSSKRTCIVQKYIHNPLLIHRRKFDIRTFCMATTQNGNYKAYYYEEGYMRTSCREFSLSNLSNRMVHLTNDAVQKKAEDYGKYEPGNKLSYAEFQNYLDKYYGNLNVRFDRDILPQIKKLTTDCFRATWRKMDPYKRFNTFECFGLDFMIDESFKVYLIEVNTNPCLELSSPLLARLIPSMVENAIRLAVDPIFPPPEHFSQRKQVVNELCPENKFELIFDEKVDGPELIEIFREKENVIIEIDEEELSDADIDGNKEAQEAND